MTPRLLPGAALLVQCIAAAHAGTVYDSYDAFYADMPDAVFRDAAQRSNGVMYSHAGDGRVYSVRRTRLAGRPLTIDISADRITVNGAVYRFARAATYPGESPTRIYPETDLFVAERTAQRPAALCVEGNSSGSGEADRHTQIYLLVDPLRKTKRPVLLHLPSLLSSCRAVLAQGDRFLFPKNTYRIDGEPAQRIGLDGRYQTFDGAKFVPVDRTFSIQFEQPENPFRFLHRIAP